MTKINSWWIFFGIATVLCYICFLGQKQSSIWGQFFTSSADPWPKGPQTLHKWQLNTTDNYKTKLKSVSKESSIDYATTREYEFVLSTTTSHINGVSRKIHVINGKYPGPLIEAFEGDTIRINVMNKLQAEDTALHFHGMSMNGTNYFDGSPGFTQCGIPPGSEFVYEFVASPAGCHWYHSHMMFQTLKGLVGPIIIHPRDTNSDQILAYRDRHALMLTDLYDARPEDLMDQYQEPWVGGDAEPVPSIALAQGIKHSDLLLQTDSVVSVVNAASYTVFNLRLASNRSFEVIEVDGSFVIPRKVQSLVIFPSQRYSIKPFINGTDWLFATPQYRIYDSDDDAIDSSKFALLKANSHDLKVLLRSNQKEPLHAPTAHSENQMSKEELTEPNFEVLSPQKIPNAKRELYVDLTMIRNNNGKITAAINGKFNEISEDNNLLFRFLTGKASLIGLQKRHSSHHRHHHHNHHHHDSMILTNSSEVLMVNSKPLTMDLIIRNFDDGPHPIHLHGHRFWVLDHGSTTVTPPSFIKFSNLESNRNTPLRDTVWVQEAQWVRIRVTLDNPGIWALHCHIPWHSLIGMRTAIVSLPNQLRKTHPPQEWFQLCDRFQDQEEDQ